jgi:limonene-1,2-epoxide hydrolase
MKKTTSSTGPEESADVTADEALVLDFIDHWGPDFEGVRRAYARCLSEDIVNENLGFPTARGKEAVLELLAMFHDAWQFEKLAPEIRNVVSGAGVVVVERVDHAYDSDGNEIGDPIPVVGVFEVRDGRICGWRDYFDPRLSMPSSAPIGADGKARSAS